MSCDIRFFPLCGYLPSEAHLLGDGNPLETIDRRLTEEHRETLRAPLLETLAFLGQGRMEPAVRPLSILNWANYVHQLLGGERDAALAHFERFVNHEHGWDPANRYTAKYHGKPMYPDTLSIAARKVVETGGGLPGLDAVLGRIAAPA